MTVRSRVRLGVILMIVAGAGMAHADVTGSFDGQLTARKLSQPIGAAAALTQIGGTVTGTVAVGGDPPFAGAYLVQGRATTKRLTLSGFVNGVSLKWRARIVGDTVAGKARLKGGGKLNATLTLTRNLPIGDGASCDAVFDQNQAFFTDQVLGEALTTCTTCHVPNGQAQSTRLHVLVTDPLATARAIAPLVDTANPDASRILEKPLALVPHGGGQQLMPGSPQEQTLRQWVDLVAQAHCN